MTPLRRVTMLLFALVDSIVTKSHLLFKHFRLAAAVAWHLTLSIIWKTVVVSSSIHLQYYNYNGSLLKATLKKEVINAIWLTWANNVNWKRASVPFIRSSVRNNSCILENNSSRRVHNLPLQKVKPCSNRHHEICTREIASPSCKGKWTWFCLSGNGGYQQSSAILPQRS